MAISRREIKRARHMQLRKILREEDMLKDIIESANNGSTNPIVKKIAKIEEELKPDLKIIK